EAEKPAVPYRGGIIGFKMPAEAGVNDALELRESGALLLGGAIEMDAAVHRSLTRARHAAHDGDRGKLVRAGAQVQAVKSEGKVTATVGAANDTVNGVLGQVNDGSGHRVREIKGSQVPLPEGSGFRSVIGVKGVDL